MSYVYGRLHAGRLLLGGIDRTSENTPDDDRHTPSFQRLLADLHQRFPYLTDVSITAAWGGAVQETGTEAPVVRRSDANPNLVLNTGYGGGSGVGMGLLSGRLVASLVLENADTDAARLLRLYERSRFPVMGPVRAVGGVLKHMLLD